MGVGQKCASFISITFVRIVSLSAKYCQEYRGLVTYKPSFGLIDWIYCPLYIHTTASVV
jgi:hypothetical protein